MFIWIYIHSLGYGEIVQILTCAQNVAPIAKNSQFEENTQPNTELQIGSCEKWVWANMSTRFPSIKQNVLNSFSLPQNVIFSEKMMSVMFPGSVDWSFAFGFSQKKTIRYVLRSFLNDSHF